ncbi:MAG: hypothetical protein FWF51_10125 [Chitinivibrionia bacterium]|nr:hypothetical protein [Chitinivibrionia bacterium]
MVSEKTIDHRDVEKVVTDILGKNKLSLVITDDAIVLTRVYADKKVSGLAAVSENVLSKDWLLREEDEAWKFL